MGGFLFDFHWLHRRICHRILHWFLLFFLMIRRPPRSTQSRSSAASDVYKRQVQGHSRSKVVMPIDSPWVVSYSTFIDPIVVSLTVFKISECHCNDLELGRFKVIQYQWLWRQSKAHWWFPVWPPLCPTSYLAPYSRRIQVQRSWC